MDQYDKSHLPIALGRFDRATVTLVVPSCAQTNDDIAGPQKARATAAPKPAEYPSTETGQDADPDIAGQVPQCAHHIGRSGASLPWRTKSVPRRRAGIFLEDRRELDALELLGLQVQPAESNSPARAIVLLGFREDLETRPLDAGHLRIAVEMSKEILNLEPVCRFMNG
ncbi:MAG TPA: hypothetical protein VKB68_20610 [Stellaceae bacterium]|nr:hypothetical protein [Stellaceae bacterium]